MSDELETAAQQALAAKLIGDAVKKHGQPARDRLGKLLADARIERRAVVAADGAKLGTVSLGGGKTTARVVDESAFLEYVAANYPDAVELRIRDTRFRRALLDNAALNAKDGVPVDGNTGERLAGTELGAGDPYPIVRPNDVGRARMDALLASSGLLAIEAGDE